MKPWPRPHPPGPLWSAVNTHSTRKRSTAVGPRTGEMEPPRILPSAAPPAALGSTTTQHLGGRASSPWPTSLPFPAHHPLVPFHVSLGHYDETVRRSWPETHTDPAGAQLLGYRGRGEGFEGWGGRHGHGPGGGLCHRGTVALADRPGLWERSSTSTVSKPVALAAGRTCPPGLETLALVRDQLQNKKL